MLSISMVNESIIWTSHNVGPKVTGHPKMFDRLQTDAKQNVNFEAVSRIQDQP